MQFYFLNAKMVGDLTGVFLAQLDEQLGQEGLPLRACRPSGGGRGGSTGSCSTAAGIAIPTDDFFAPGSGAADRAVRARRRASSSRSTRWRCAPPAATPKLIDAEVRDDPRANALFLDVLTCRAIARDGAALDERGRRVRPLRSRFRPRRRPDAVRHVPSLYGRRAFDPRDRPARRDRARRAQGRSSARRPRSVRQIASRRVLYVAVLLHDIAKGRGGDHSELGAEIALRLCPRLGLDPTPRPRPSPGWSATTC